MFWLSLILSIISVICNVSAAYLFMQAKMMLLEHTLQERDNNDKKYALITSVDDVKTNVEYIREKLDKLYEYVIKGNEHE